MNEITTSTGDAYPSEPPTGHVRKSKRRFWIAGGIILLLAVSVISVILIQRWRRTPKIKMTLQIPSKQGAMSIAFSPDGKIIAAIGYDLVWLWDTQTGKLLQTLKPKFEDDDKRRYGKSLAFSPDSKTLAASFLTVVKLFDVQTGTQKLELRTQMDGLAFTLAFSPDGKTLATGTPLRLWDAQTGELKQELTTKFSFVRRVAFSPDGGTLAAADLGKGEHWFVINLWDMQTLQIKRTLTESDDILELVAFSPDGMSVISGNASDGIKIWDAQTGELKRTLDVGPDELAFSPDGKMLVFDSGLYDSSKSGTWLYDTQSWTPLHKFPYPLHDAVFSPDSKVLADKQGYSIEFWDVSGLK